MKETQADSPSYRVLGVRVDAVQIPEVCARVADWIAHRDGCRYVAVTGMHGIMEAQHEPAFKAVLNAADLVVPDGMPLVWLGRIRGRPVNRRVYGPELMLEVCRRTASRNVSHFLVGGAPGVADRLATALRHRFAELAISGTCSPPFHPLSEGQEEDLLETINRAAPDIVWVGFSTPKQEQWMHRHRNRLNAAVLLGVGAAFDIHSGTRSQAPAWMRENGWEWLFRLIQEPRRLWRRYLLYGPQFLFYVVLELLNLRKFE
jgi:N-acetylglucosaminyldiphosphoundecaprenol N-acetyl-beta-D-mannosaminyltransferase